MPQINARLSPESRQRFADYASKLGLDAAELARLLIVRELHTKRILSSKAPNKVAPQQAKRQLKKLTAHFHQIEQIAQFDRYAGANGLSRAAAAKLIFEHELYEEWLARAFFWKLPARSGPSDKTVRARRR
jgi:hypothetical protein